ncbi:MAG: epoxyqueuosine reductase [Clostridia bacterium]|nr:epoxyqueuosine reductase [Clostridia bacterium]
MFSIIKEELNKNGIERIGFIDIRDCEIINQRILPQWARSVVIFCIPYRSSKEIADDGFSEYARIYDYHNYSKQLYEIVISQLNSKTNCRFMGFCDHSPINEKLAAAKCDLGVIGKNSLFIDKIYGSFVFLGSLITDIECNIPAVEIKHCYNCGLCIDACPNNAIIEFGIDRYKCLSGISQKKKKTDEEKLLLKEHNIVWGCDICQNVCPYNKDAKISPIPYFQKTRVSKIDVEYINGLSDEEFNKFAFSYKGRDIVVNNINFE